MKLSPRLQWIYERLLPGQPVWDLGCDHGFLGREALASACFPAVHFVDQVPHLIASLQQELAGQPGARFCAQAAESLQEPVQGTLVIAGMGAHAMHKILEGLASQKFLQAQRLILGPQRDEKLLLETVPKLTGYSLQEQEWIQERGRARLLSVWECC